MPRQYKWLESLRNGESRWDEMHTGYSGATRKIQLLAFSGCAKYAVAPWNTPWRSTAAEDARSGHIARVGDPRTNSLLRLEHDLQYRQPILFIKVTNKSHHLLAC
jgi:hypothetical protein